MSDLMIAFLCLAFLAMGFLAGFCIGSSHESYKGNKEE